jgi:uracil-DNA glycosylase family 4
MNTDSLATFVEEIRASRALPDDVPGFDPGNGNENAKFLLVLEAPGPRAIESGIVSIENQDATARNLKELLSAANIEKNEIAIWNVVPWYIGNEARTQIRSPNPTDIDQGIESLVRLIPKFINLRCILLIGSSARKAHIRLSSATTARILACHHTSQRVANTTAKSKQENAAVFSYMRSTTP